MPITAVLDFAFLTGQSRENPITAINGLLTFPEVRSVS